MKGYYHGVLPTIDDDLKGKTRGELELIGRQLRIPWVTRFETKAELAYAITVTRIRKG